MKTHQLIVIRYIMHLDLVLAIMSRLLHSFCSVPNVSSHGCRFEHHHASHVLLDPLHAIRAGIGIFFCIVTSLLLDKCFFLAASNTRSSSSNRHEIPTMWYRLIVMMKFFQCERKRQMKTQPHTMPLK